jgi:hypothetical protein
MKKTPQILPPQRQHRASVADRDALDRGARPRGGIGGRTLGARPASMGVIPQRSLIWNGPLCVTTRTGGPPFPRVVVIQPRRWLDSMG